MCRLDGATLAEINSAAENTYLKSTTKQQGGGKKMKYITKY